MKKKNIVLVSLVLVVLIILSLIVILTRKSNESIEAEEDIEKVAFTNVPKISSETKEKLIADYDQIFRDKCIDQGKCDVKDYLKYKFLEIDLNRELSESNKDFLNKELIQIESNYREVYENRAKDENPVLTNDDENLIYLIYLMDIMELVEQEDLEYWFDLLENFEFADSTIKYKFVILLNRRAFEGIEARDNIVSTFCDSGSPQTIFNSTMMTTEILDQVYTKENFFPCS